MTTALELPQEKKVMLNILWGVVVVMLVLWLLGFTMHIGGALIHILLVAALITVVVRLAMGMRPA
jgi:hypothetical protein